MDTNAPASEQVTEQTKQEYAVQVNAIIVVECDCDALAIMRGIREVLKGRKVARNTFTIVDGPTPGKLASLPPVPQQHA